MSYAILYFLFFPSSSWILSFWVWVCFQPLLLPSRSRHKMPFQKTLTLSEELHPKCMAVLVVGKQTEASRLKPTPGNPSAESSATLRNTNNVSQLDALFCLLKDYLLHTPPSTTFIASCIPPYVFLAVLLIILFFYYFLPSFLYSYSYISFEVLRVPLTSLLPYI